VVRTQHAHVCKRGGAASALYGLAKAAMLSVCAVPCRKAFGEVCACQYFGKFCW
jgi:hypothetical protein